MQAFGITRLALEWDEDLAPVIEAFLASGTLADHWLLWAGDGRITAGHLAVLADRATAGSLEVILFDGAIGAEQGWAHRDAAMARRLLAAAPARARTLAVAGNAHTPTSPTELGIPDGGLAAPAAARGAGDPHQLRQRAILQQPATPVRPPRPTAAPDPAPPATRLACPRPSHGAGGDRAPPIRGMAAARTHHTLTAACAGIAHAGSLVYPCRLGPPIWCACSRMRRAR